jgi:putative PIG3 family NAD(P)H quinone oxidoreductase
MRLKRTTDGHHVDGGLFAPAHIPAPGARMKALRIVAGDPPRLELADSPTPQPSAHEVLVRVTAAGLNRADLLQLSGRYPVPADAPADIPGIEFTGVVETLGSGCERVKAGQRVFGLASGGAHAQFVAVPETILVNTPDSIDDVHAAAIAEAYITAHDALFTQAGLALGERLLVHAAASGVGIAALQIGAMAGCQLFATTRTQAKVDAMARLSQQPDPLIPAAAILLPDGFDQEILERTHGAGVDVILDPVGAAYFDRNLAVLGPRGRIISIATMSGSTVTLDLGALMRKRLRLFGIVLRGRSLAERVAATRSFEREVMPNIAAGRMKPVVDTTFALKDGTAAYAYMAANRNLGKIVLTI